MKKTEAAAALVVAFVYVMLLFPSNLPVMATSGTISTDRPVYPYWGLGGTITVTVQNFAPNLTYYFWLQKPKQPTSYPLPTHFTVPNTGSVPPMSISILASDPAGTYALTLSNSTFVDTHSASAHFGVSGTSSQTYERTQNVTLAGGGFTPNSSVSLTIKAGNATYPSFPRNVTTDTNGDYAYTFKLTPSAIIGLLRTYARGNSFDKHQATNTTSSFAVQPTTINAVTINAPLSPVERTIAINATYSLSYPDGSPVSSANATVDIISNGITVAKEPLIPVNTTTGEYAVVWKTSPSTNATTYHFSMTPSTLIDPYGNRGQGSTISSTDFAVTTAKLQPVVQTDAVRERTQNSTITISTLYPDGNAVLNETHVAATLTQPNGTRTKLSFSVTGSTARSGFRIPINATLGNWTVTYSVQDPWGNAVTGNFGIQVVLASPVFNLGTPPTVQRTTILNVTATISYPDGSPWNKTITMAIIHGNQTITPKLSLNSTTLQWSGSHYFGQNDTLGPYNVTWGAVDTYGNGGAINSTTLVIPAQFLFYLKSNNSTVPMYSNLDVPITVTYPNGTRLPSSYGNLTYGNVTASYQNATGYIFTLPLAYNATNGTWHMYFTPTQDGNFTFSFTGVDRFGNTGMVSDAYVLKVNPTSGILSQRLLIAGVIGTLVPAGVLIWALATISTRRRKHKP